MSDMDIETAKRVLQRYGVSFGFDRNVKIMELSIPIFLAVTPKISSYGIFDKLNPAGLDTETTMEITRALGDRLARINKFVASVLKEMEMPGSDA